MPRKNFVNRQELLLKSLKYFVLFLSDLAILPPRVDPECQQDARDDSHTFSK